MAKDKTNELKEIKGAAVWQYDQEGTDISGELVEIPQGAYGNNYVIKTISGEEFTVFGNVVLATKMSRVKIGTFVRITYLGEVKASSGRTYKDFKVEAA